MNHVSELDEFSIHAELSEKGGIALLFFSGPHCSSCHHLKNLLNTEFKQFEDHFAKQLTSFSVHEIKADKAAALVNEFGVFHLPSMYLYREGEYHCQLQAEAIPEKIIDAIDVALAKPAEEEP